MGFAQYGMKAEVMRVFEALFDAATYQELPGGLFSGTSRRECHKRTMAASCGPSHFQV